MATFVIKSISKMQDCIEVLVEIDDGWTKEQDIFRLNVIEQVDLAYITLEVATKLAGIAALNERMLLLATEIDVPRSV